MEINKRAIRIIVLFILSAVLLWIIAMLVTEKIEKRIYPLKYESSIQRCCTEYDLEEDLIAAVIFTESSWREDAISPKGAVGLMQIMPSTGEWIAQKQEQTDYTDTKLLQPELNIEYGCWYLRYLLDKYEQNTRYALIAYNAGPGNLDKWLCDTEYSENGMLHCIPFRQTEEYVEKIERAREKYKEIY